MAENDLLRNIGVAITLFAIITLLIGGIRLHEGIIVTLGVNLAIIIAIIGVIAMFYGIIKS